MILVNRRTRKIPEKAFLLVLLLIMGLIVEVGEVTTLIFYPPPLGKKLEWWSDTRIFNPEVNYPRGLGIKWGMSQEEIYQIELPLLGEPKEIGENRLVYGQGDGRQINETLIYTFEDEKLIRVEYSRLETTPLRLDSNSPVGPGRGMRYVTGDIEVTIKYERHPLIWGARILRVTYQKA